MIGATTPALPLAANLCLCLLGVVAGFLDAPSTALIAVILSFGLLLDRSRCWLPGRLVLLWHYINYIIAPVIDQDLSSPSWIFALVASVSFLAHAIYLLLPARQEHTDEILARLGAISLSTCLALTLLSGLSMAYLISIGAFEHLAGKAVVSAPFKGLAGDWKTLLYPALAILGLRWQQELRSGWLAMALLMLALAASLLSGRKEETVLAFATFAIFSYTGTSRITGRLLMTITLSLIIATAAVGFLYQMRQHRFFFSSGYDASIQTVISDAFAGRNLVDNHRFSPWSRLNHHIQTERYLNQDRPLLDAQEAGEMAIYTLTPGLMKERPNLVAPTLGFTFGYLLGSAQYYGDSAVSAGPIVEFWEFFGGFGLLLVVLMPVLLDRTLLLVLAVPQFGLLLFWVLYLRSITYERYLLAFIASIPILILPLVALGLLERRLFSKLRFFQFPLPATDRGATSMP